MRRRYSKTVLNEYEFKKEIKGKLITIVCQYKRCKYLKIKLASDDMLLLITPNKMTQEEASKTIDTYLDKVIKILNTKKIMLEEDEFLLFGKTYKKEEYTSKEINKMYSDGLALMSEMFNTIMNTYHFPKTLLYIRKMRSRWGVCYPKEKKIGLSSYLVLVPKYLIEYVIFHEFCHFKYPNHGKEFYQELYKYSPNHKIYKKELKYYSNLLK